MVYHLFIATILDTNANALAVCFSQRCFGLLNDFCHSISQWQLHGSMDEAFNAECCFGITTQHCCALLTANEAAVSAARCK